MNENQFLQALFKRLPVANCDLIIPPGDDCAAIRQADGSLQLLAVDQVVGNRHYYQAGDTATPARLVGRKLLARNLSDIAAMGGIPQYCLVSVAAGAGVDYVWLDGVLDGIIALGREFGVEMIGGDLATTDSDTVASLTIVGKVSADRVCRRVGAGVGDFLFATGCFGDSLVSEHHLNFVPRVAEGAWLAEQGVVNAMIDVSDGLVIDLERICRASGVGVCLFADKILRRSKTTSLQAVLSDGEDYELIFAVPASVAKKLLRDWKFVDTALTIIGEFILPRDGGLVVFDNDELLANLERTGYDHLTALE